MSIPVQIPSRKLATSSAEEKQLSEVRSSRFLDRRDPDDHFDDDPWNLLELHNAIPPLTLPRVLSNGNCQLLSHLRDAAVLGARANRATATPGQWEVWRGVESWALLSEGGHHTCPHTDSHGYSTWITVQESRIGFAWMSLPTPEDWAEWMANPQGYTGGQWRYVILKPVRPCSSLQGLSTPCSVWVGARIRRWRWVAIFFSGRALNDGSRS